MARNVEIKARATDWDTQLSAARRIADSVHLISQRDTFYRVPDGRLKLRVIDGHEGQLICYCRPDVLAPKLSDYHITEVANVESMDAVLTAALGRCGHIVKRRTVILVETTRIHFDEVEGLGRFIEIEVVLEAGMTESDGNSTARRTMAQLCINNSDLITGAYVDLLAAAATYSDS